MKLNQSIYWFFSENTAISFCFLHFHI
jgi:hypothetical protein